MLFKDAFLRAPFVSIDAEERGRAALDHILEAIARYRVAVGDLGFDELVKDFRPISCGRTLCGDHF